MANIDQSKLREAMQARNLGDEQTARTVGEVAQEVWQDATQDFATEDKIAIAIAEVRGDFQRLERFVVEQVAEMRQELNTFRLEQAERDATFWREQAERDREHRREQAERDREHRREQAERDREFRGEQTDRDRLNNEARDRQEIRTRWLLGLGFTAFGALTALLAIFA